MPTISKLDAMSEINDTTETHEIYLNDIWTFYFHDPYDSDWTTQSYVCLGNISTPKEFWAINNSVRDRIKSGIFFVMREFVFPAWDDPSNIHGGCLSIKVLKENIGEYWAELCAKVLGETLLIDSNKNQWNVVNGISTSPKKYFCIVKIWLGTNDLNDKKFFNLPEKNYGDIIYRENMENIHKNNEHS